MTSTEIIPVSIELDRSGLVWHPEIGDEVTERHDLERVAILVDPLGMTPTELRQTFLWLPSVEQLVLQFEARQALIYHAGIDESLQYEAIVRTGLGVIEAKARTLRVALGKALRELLLHTTNGAVH